MTSLENLGAEEKEALASTKLAGLRKKLNAEAWTDNMEDLMKQWGEKSAGLRFMHSNAGNSWKKFSNQLSITGIVITSFASTVSLIATSLDDEQAKTNVMYAVGGIGLISTLIQSFKKFSLSIRFLQNTCTTDGKTYATGGLKNSRVSTNQL